QSTTREEGPANRRAWGRQASQAGRSGGGAAAPCGVGTPHAPPDRQPTVSTREPTILGASPDQGQAVEGAGHAGGAAVEDVGVDHGGADVGVAEQVLDGADVAARLEQVGGEAVPQGVRADALGPAEGPDGGGDGEVDTPLVDVVAARVAGA